MYILLNYGLATVSYILFSIFQNRNGDFVVLYDAELECKQHTIVYDSNTSDLRDCNGP